MSSSLIVGLVLIAIALFAIFDARRDYKPGDKVGTFLFKLLFVVFFVGGLGFLVFWTWSNLDEEWVCYTKDGGIIYTESKPKGEWVESVSGTRYPQEVIASCHER